LYLFVVSDKKWDFEIYRFFSEKSFLLKNELSYEPTLYVSKYIEKVLKIPEFFILKTKIY